MFPFTRIVILVVRLYSTVLRQGMLGKTVVKSKSV